MPLLSTHFSRSARLALALVVLLGGLLRFYALDRLPPGLYQDEAVEGFDALRVLHGEFPIYLESNNGREPAFVYFLAAGIALLGRTPLALRAVSAAAGTAAIPIAYMAAKELFSRRAALLTAFVIATTLWPVQLSRLGLRSSLLPAALGLGIWGLARAWRRNHWRDWLLAGLLLGLSLYTYIPARLALTVPLVVTLIGWFGGLDRRKTLRGGLALLLAYGLTALPLGVYALGHWDLVNGRAAQVSVLNPDINQGHLLDTLLNQGLLVAKMFLIRGDSNLRHNVPGRPVFDLAMALAGLAGLVVGLVRIRERRWQWTWVWLGVFLVPTFLADSAPHFLRAYGVWPMLAVFPAVGLGAIVNLLKRRVGLLAAVLAGSAIAGASVFATAQAYFLTDWLTSRQAYYSFDTFSTDLVAAVNQFTGTGWQGVWQPGEPQPGPRGEVWIDPRLYHFTKTVEFLIPQNPSLSHSAVHLLMPDAGPLAAAPLVDRDVRLIVVPGDEASHLSLLPHDSLITIRDGSRAKADVEVKPFLLFRSITAQPAADLAGSAACFEAGLELLPPVVSVGPNELVADLLWRAKTGPIPPLTVFLHWYQNGVLVGQSDSFPAGGLFPFGWLRPGDVIRDTRTIPLGPGAVSPPTGKVGVGLYDAANGQRQAATDCAGRSLGDEVFVR
jgi:4-amino-4-deoxy-L-arabinose transferase-like glycosyltransferase